MAWTTPRTWNPGETVTATIMNTHVRDNLNVIKSEIRDDGLLEARKLIHSDFTGWANSGTSETDMSAYTIPADTFDEDYVTMIFSVWGTFVNNANNKRVDFYIGSNKHSLIWNAAWQSATSIYWQGEIKLIRLGSSSQRYFSMGQWIHGGTAYHFPSSGTDSQDETGTIAFKLTSQSGTASNDITQIGLQIEVEYPVS